MLYVSTHKGHTEENLRKFADSKWKQRFKRKKKQESQVKMVLYSDRNLPR